MTSRPLIFNTLFNVVMPTTGRVQLGECRKKRRTYFYALALASKVNHTAKDMWLTQPTRS